MNPLSLMECNVKSSLQWDLDNLISFNTSTELPRKFRAADWEIDAGGGIGSVSLFSSGFAGVAGASDSDLEHPAFSKSSKSTSIGSSSIEMKTYKFTSVAGDGLPEDLCSTEEFAKGIGTSPTLETSYGSGEMVIGLKLGKRTYFEDICAGNNNPKGSTFPGGIASAVAPMKRSKAIFQSMSTPRCQVEGCNLDLSSAKDYHRKHRVCESHSKCPKVIVGGLERRFCQQCSRFHGLSEFDEKKRSCRRRLSDHNARRRKPQPEAIQLNPGRICDGKQQMNLVWNRFALIHTRSEEKYLWETPHSLKPTQSKGLMLKPAKFECFDGQLVFDSNRPPSSTTTQQGASGFLPSKTKFARAEIPSKGVEEFTVSSNLGGTQDFHRALSLLSTTSTTTTSWGSCEPKIVSLSQPTNSLEPVLHPMSQPFPLSSSDYWRTEQQLIEPTASHRDDGSRFQEIQVFRSPYESYFCSNQLN